MASGVIVGTKYFDAHYWIEVHWSSTVNTTNVTSAVTASVYFCSDYSVSYSASKNGNTTVNGSSLNWSVTKTVNHSNPPGEPTKTLIHTRSAVTVSHNADGSKSIPMTAWYTPNLSITGYGNLGQMNLSGTANLGTIATNTVSVWDGVDGGWRNSKPVKVWNGTAWVSALGVWVWNGSSWIKS